MLQMRTRVISSFGTRRHRGWFATGAAILATFCAPGVASGAILSGHVDGGTGGTGSPSRQITGLDLRYDTTGSITATTTFGGDPATGEAATLFVYLGTVSGTYCESPWALIGAELRPGGAVVGATTAASTAQPGTGTYGPASLTTAVSGPQYAGLPYTCIFARVQPAGDSATILGRTAGWEPIAAERPRPPHRPRRPRPSRRRRPRQPPPLPRRHPCCRST